MNISQKIVFLILLNVIGASLIFGLLFFNFGFKTEIISGVYLIFISSSLYFGYKIRKHLSASLFNLDFQIKNTFDFLAYKKNKIEIVEKQNNDEFSVINEAINKHIKDLINIRESEMKILGETTIALDKVSQGIYDSNITSDTYSFIGTSLKNSINNMVEKSSQNIGELVLFIESLSKHDYSKKIIVPYELKGDMKLTFERLNFLCQELNKSARSSLDNGDLLKNSSVEMNSIVNNILHKTSEQSASLEETAAAIEEITSITKNNTENAIKMAELSTLVKNAIISGEKLASETAIAMSTITKEVSSINEAIESIDQIAFQTNILSLNAAVEAATAGESGKGFAVVAGEVRNLANRSSESAKEIKALVENANSKANNGKIISDKMIEDYLSLNKLITETISIIQDVTNGSREQLIGIEQINNAISVLDKTSQQNTLEVSSVTEIAEETLKIANLLVNEAKRKRI